MSNRTILQPRSRLSMRGGGSSDSRPGSTNTYYSQTPPQSRHQATPFHTHNMEEQHRMNSAVIKREENELLVWKSIDRNESIPQTKLHYDRDMLLLDSDADEDDDESGESGAGSVEWQEDHAWDSDDQARMQPGVVFGPDGWYDPRLHGSVQERMRADEERRRAAAVSSGKARVKDEDVVSPQQGTPRSRRVNSSARGSPSGTPGRKGKSGGKRAMSGESGSQV